MDGLNRMFASAKESESDWPGQEPDRANSSGHVGLWNVHQRLRLRFGAPYGLHIVKSDQEGTWIEVRLPKCEGENTGC
ncbi:hypothetical protein SK3146_01607 [Paenibacillus konkukensis]|uniref:Uncharacterized protein n=2 Tax=Paenibacillus konkukensis TaxID=2020716 RepID=A0ABY4RKS7_9BACL|nr:hypothetical protein SK3146_01607 [Paenibacillus konkukensis]